MTDEVKWRLGRGGLEHAITYSVDLTRAASFRVGFACGVALPTFVVPGPDGSRRCRKCKRRLVELDEQHRQATLDLFGEA